MKTRLLAAAALCVFVALNAGAQSQGGSEGKSDTAKTDAGKKADKGGKKGHKGGKKSKKGSNSPGNEGGTKSATAPPPK